VTYRVVARRTGAHFGDVRSMLESMVPDRGGQEGDLSA